MKWKLFGHTLVRGNFKNLVEENDIRHLVSSVSSHFDIYQIFTTKSYIKHLFVLLHKNVEGKNKKNPSSTSYKKLKMYPRNRHISVEKNILHST